MAKIWTFLVDSIQTLLLAFSVFLVIYVFLFRPFQVNGLSMFPNFQDKEYVLTNLLGFEKLGPYKAHFNEPQIGEVIVFKAPKEPDKDFIKRVIGLPGDTISVTNGDVYRNGKKLDQSSFLAPDVKSYPSEFLHEGEVITVPPDQYFVMGDNRPNSSDSREWGFVPRDNIVGKSMFVYWPPSEMKIVKNPLSAK